MDNKPSWPETGFLLGSITQPTEKAKDHKTQKANKTVKVVCLDCEHEFEIEINRCQNGQHGCCSKQK